MTVSEYQERHGASLRAAQTQGWFVALMNVLQGQHPVKELRTINDGDKLAGAPLYLSRIDGYENCLGKISECAEQAIPNVEPKEDSYTEDEIPIEP